MSDIKFPMELTNASPVHVEYSWQSLAAIQLGTKRGWWGNALQPSNLQVGGEYAEVGPEAITIDREFLARKEALAIEALKPLVSLDIASNVVALCSNPQADRIECEVYPELVGALPEVEVQGGTFESYFRKTESTVEIWQDTVGSGETIQDTIASGETIQDTIP